MRLDPVAELVIAHSTPAGVKHDRDYGCGKLYGSPDVPCGRRFESCRGFSL